MIINRNEILTAFQSKDLKTGANAIETGLNKYLQIQEEFNSDPQSHNNPNFRRKFNHFYRIRRKPEWQDTYYGIMGDVRDANSSFENVLKLLLEKTGRFETSFASKLVATIDPSKPVIDKFVLLNTKLSLPTSRKKDRFEKTLEVYDDLQRKLVTFLDTGFGNYLIKEFDRQFAGVQITNIKKLDLVLWQMRN